MSPNDSPGPIDGFSLTIAGFGVEAKPKLPVGVAHLDDGALLFAPMNAELAKAAPGREPPPEAREGVPIDGDAQHLLRSQGTLDVADTMFSAADLVATSFRPRRR